MARRKNSFITRFFTKEGVHPYDEVNWVKRNAEIPGSGFKMENVEFPDFYSQNAVNIIASKYFKVNRGKQETSLKELIDRVVKTFKKWGLEQGYFDEKEAEIYEKELTYIILHQYATFNSPVWFNVGVEGRSQQCSACFILDVEDNMESILDWIKIEGLIFKGGSGSGVNLSKLRGKGEKLSTGGASSGVISFMRAADAVAGSIKCLPKGTEIVTKEGIKKIEDLEENDEVLTRFGFQKIGRKYYTGKKKIYKITTELGIEILASAEHKFLVRKEGGIEEWKELRELDLDKDYLILDLSLKEYGTYQKLEKIELQHHNEKPIKMPEILDEKFAEWLGLLYGDGNITNIKYANKRSTHYIGFQVDVQDKDLIKYIQDLSYELFGVKSFIHRRKDKKDNSVSVRITSYPLIRFLKVNGLYKTKGDKIRVPEKIKNSPPAVRAAFLRGYFESDGSITKNKPYPACSSINKEFIEDIQNLLFSLGILNKKRISKSRKNSYGKRPVYNLIVTSSFGIKRFFDLVNFISERKKRKFERAIKILDKRPFEQRWILPYPEKDLEIVYQSIPNETRYFFRRLTSKYFRETVGKTNFNRFRANYLLSKFPFLENTFIGYFAKNDVYYEKIKEIKFFGEEETYDIFVPNVNEYLVKNIVVHNSGGATRRAAKMVILNADHPEIMDFIRVKAEEENKVRALMEAGYDMTDMNNPLWQNIFFQNANNSVRIPDALMEAAMKDGEWKTYYRTTGEVAKTYKAKDILWEIAKAAWECGDPGVQFDGSIQKWHTCKNSGRIEATNPCVTGDTLIATAEGWKRIKDLVGKKPEIITHRGVKKAVKVFKTGIKPVYRIKTKAGYELKVTEDHPIYVEGKGDVKVKDLKIGDKVKLIGSYFGKESLDKDIAFMIGYFAGDGAMSFDAKRNHYSVFFTGGEEDVYALSYIQKTINQKLQYKNRRNVSLRKLPSEYVVATGKENVAQIIDEYFDSKKKIFKDKIYDLDKESVKYVLQGLFTADGTIAGNPEKGFYVGLDNSSLELLKQVQLLLLNFGIKAKIYENRRKTLAQYLPDSQRNLKLYKVKNFHSLRITRSSRIIFENEIGFYFNHSKSEKLEKINQNYEAYKDQLFDEIKEIKFEGIEEVYDLTEPETSHFVANGILVHNCSEYIFLNWTSCNLSSINLLKFLKEDGSFDVPAFIHTARVMFLSQDLLISKADYPHPKIAEETKKYRTIGLGYTNLGALIMALGLPYDSDEARDLAASITALMTGTAYKLSAEISSKLGPFPEYEKNKEPMMEVMKMHKDHLKYVKENEFNKEILEKAKEVWDEVIELGEKYGFRNAQSTVIAPTGTISFMLDCDTTGIEPDFALVKMKQLVGGGYMKIVNKTVPLALKRLGYSEEQIKDIVKHLEETQNIETAPHLKEEHLPVFDCAIKPPGGKRYIHWMGHVKMVAAVQPFVSGGISKTFNMPNETTIQEIYDAYFTAWKLGIKCFAVYRDGSKATQALYVSKQEKKQKETFTRKRLPDIRPSETHKFSIAGHEGYLTYSTFEDGSLGEIFIRMAKQGSTLSGLLDAFAIAVSIALQYGVPLKELASKFINMRFEPMGLTNNEKIKTATSIVDYIFKYLAYRFLSKEDLEELGLMTEEEKDKLILKEHPTLFEKKNNPTSNPSNHLKDISGPPCVHCGGITIKTGSCYTCISCGETTSCG
jgi:ribonucleoside-diphosphate reductase alpha chain